MTQPRRVLPGTIVMVTRRTVRRTHLLRPDPALNNLFIYCLAVTAAKHGVLVHAAVLMSTHEHLIVTDTQGRLPRFLQELHRLVALSVKVLRGWEGAVWDHEKTSVVELRTPEAVREKIAYVMANPVAAGLVRKSCEWPGVTLSAEDLGRAKWKAHRPAGYFDPRNATWPATVTLQLALPDAFAHAPERARDAVAAELHALEAEARMSVRRERMTVLGSKKVCALSPYRRSRSWEPARARNPTFAVGRNMRDEQLRAIRELRAFRHDYRCVLAQWRAGRRDIPFPLGTWLMRSCHAAAIAA